MTPGDDLIGDVSNVGVGHMVDRATPEGRHKIPVQAGLDQFPRNPILPCRSLQSPLPCIRADRPTPFEKGRDMVGGMQNPGGAAGPVGRGLIEEASRNAGGSCGKGVHETVLSGERFGGTITIVDQLPEWGILVNVACGHMFALCPETERPDGTAGPGRCFEGRYLAAWR